MENNSNSSLVQCHTQNIHKDIKNKSNVGKMIHVSIPIKAAIFEKMAMNMESKLNPIAN